jgi:hypothetical protein
VEKKILAAHPEWADPEVNPDWLRDKIELVKEYGEGFCPYTLVAVGNYDFYCHLAALRAASETEPPDNCPIAVDGRRWGPCNCGYAWDVEYEARKRGLVALELDPPLNERGEKQSWEEFEPQQKYN